MISLQIDATVKGIAFRYYGYYYSNENGTLQVIAYTGQKLFSEYEQDFTELLNGIEIHQPPPVDAPKK